MYRAVALWAVRQKVDPGDMHRAEQLAIAAEIELSPGRIALNGEDITDAIRTPEVSSGASKIAVIPGVRRAMVAKQREIGERTSVVMEGRDIGTVVFPDAQVKVYLDANPEERVRRRCEEMRAKGEPVNAARLAAQMRERHEEACRELLPAAEQGGVLAKLHDVIDEFERIVNGMAMLGERPPRSVDEAVAVGERLTAVLVSEYLRATGTPSVGVNARD